MTRRTWRFIIAVSVLDGAAFGLLLDFIGYWAFAFEPAFIALGALTGRNCYRADHVPIEPELTLPS